MKKTLAFLALLIAAPAFGQLTPVLAYCMNPSGVSIVLNGLGGVAAGFTPGTSVQLYGQTAGGVTTAVQCDASGNLILASLPQNATDPATCATGQVEFNTTANVPKYCYPANTWNSWTGGGGTVTGSGTTNYYPLWSGASSVANGTIDHGLTTAGTDTDSYNFAAPQITVTGNCTLTSTAIGCPGFLEGTLPTTGLAGTTYIASDSAGLAQSANNGTWYHFLSAAPASVPNSALVASTSITRVTFGNSAAAGTAVGTGTTPSFTSPFIGTIISATLTGTLSAGNCSAVIDVWKVNAAIPTVTNTITASALPTLSTAKYAQNTTLSGWTTSIAKNDVLMANVQSATCDNWNLVLAVQQ